MLSRNVRMIQNHYLLGRHFLDVGNLPIVFQQSLYPHPAAWNLKYAPQVFQRFSGELDDAERIVPVGWFVPWESHIQTPGTPIEAATRNLYFCYNYSAPQLLDAHINVEYILDSVDFSRYRVIVVPYALYLSPESENKLRAFVEGGGVALFFGPPGLYDQWARPSGKLPADWFGVIKSEPWRAPQGVRFGAARFGVDNRPGACWRFTLGAVKAEVLGSYEGVDQSPALLRARPGKGVAYLAGFPPVSSLTALLDECFRKHIPEPVKVDSSNIHLYHWRQGCDRITFLINQSLSEQRAVIELDAQRKVVDLRTGVTTSGRSFEYRFSPGECRSWWICGACQ